MMQKYHYNFEEAASYNPFADYDFNSYRYPKEIFRGFVSMNALDHASLKLPGVYLIHHLATDQVYLGSTGAVEERIRIHMGTLRRDQHFVKDLQSVYNESQLVDVYYHPTTTRKEAYELEQALLDQHIGQPYLFNVAPTATSQTGFKHSDETKRKMSEVRSTPEMRELMANVHRGRVLTDEHKAAISAGGKGRVVSQETRDLLSSIHKGVKRSAELGAQVSATKRARAKKISINGVIYRGASEAHEMIGVGRSTIEYRLNSKEPAWKDWIRLEE